MGLPSPLELTGGAPKILRGSLSFEMSVIIQIIILGHLCTVICFEIGQIMGLPSPSELTGGVPKFLR